MVTITSSAGHPDPEGTHETKSSTRATLRLVLIPQNDKSRLSETNCRNINIPTRPQTLCLSNPYDAAEALGKSSMACAVSRRQPPSIDISEDSPTPSRTSTITQAHFRFLDLPTELRLKVYGYIFPSREFKIASQYPYSGSYFQSPPRNSSQSLYSPIQDTQKKSLTTYFILPGSTVRARTEAKNTRFETAILLSCRGIWREAETIFYEACHLDFGEYVESVIPFLRDRSFNAQQAIRRVSLSISILSIGDSGFRDCMVQLRRKEMFEVAVAEIGVLCGGLINLETRILCRGRGCLGGGSGERSWDTLGGEVENLEGSIEFLAAHEMSIRRGDEGLSQEEREWESVREMVRASSIHHMKVKWIGFGRGDKLAENRFEDWLNRRMHCSS